MKLISIEEYRKLFNEEFRKTQRLIEQGETHLDNLAEGFTEADRVLRSMPTIDVAADNLSRLQTLTEADKKGRAVILPCKVGDTVYAVFGTEIVEKTVGKIIINSYTNPQIWVELDCTFMASVTKRWDLSVGKDFYLTREEADEALRAKEEKNTTTGNGGAKMPEYINRRTAMVLLEKYGEPEDVIALIDAIPAAVVVEPEEYFQVRRERDAAEKQLESIGKSLGESMDDVVQVVRCEKCRFCSGTYCNHPKGLHHVSADPPNSDDFCSYGKAR